MRLTMPRAGRITLAAAIREREVFLAIGEGSPQWDDRPPPLSLETSKLEAPIAFVRARTCAFVRPCTHKRLRCWFELFCSGFVFAGRRTCRSIFKTGKRKAGAK